MATQDQLPDLDKFFNTVKEAHNMHDCWEKYENIFKGAYEREEKYVPKNKTRKVKKMYK